MDTWDLWQLEASIFKEKVIWRGKFSSFPVSLWHMGYQKKMGMWDGVEFSSLEAISEFSETKFAVQIFLLAFAS